MRTIYAVDLDHVNSKNRICFKLVNDDAWLWHRRLHYATMHIANELSKHNLLKGLPKHNHDKD